MDVWSQFAAASAGPRNARDAADRLNGRDSSGEGQLLTRRRTALKRPSMYRVLVLNDDYTPMEFVVWILEAVFYKPHEEAVRLMLDVHNKGKGCCGVYAHDTARTKAAQVHELAQRHEHPLECRLEVAEGEDEGADDSGRQGDGA